MSNQITQKAIFDKEQNRKDSQKKCGKTSRQLRRQAAKKKKRGLEPAHAPDAPYTRSAAGDLCPPLSDVPCNST
jgi:hypothetical protein